MGVKLQKKMTAGVHAFNRVYMQCSFRYLYMQPGLPLLMRAYTLINRPHCIYTPDRCWQLTLDTTTKILTRFSSAIVIYLKSLFNSESLIKICNYEK